MIQIETSIKRITDTYTSSDPVRYEIVIKGKGALRECEFVANALNVASRIDAALKEAEKKLPLKRNNQDRCRPYGYGIVLTQKG